LTRTFGQVAGLRTIELGSGRGDLSVLLAERGAKATLLDASDQALVQAERRFDRLGRAAEFVQADLFDLSQRLHRRFDVALSSGVIEHFRGDRRSDAIRAHFDVLRDGGLAVISVPHAWCLPYRLWKGYLELRGWWPYGLEIPYTKRELIRRARETGFRQAEAVALGFWQSIGDRLRPGQSGRRRDWVARRSILDPFMGLSAVLFAQR
jgi:cyclopropane fatty-acyl-phospholipid synthase-like methyltransferase